MLKINSPLEFPLLFFLDPPPVLCVSFFLWQPFFLFVGHTLKKICVATSRVLTIKILGSFRPTLTFFLRTNHVCFLIRYDILVLMYSKEAFFPPGNYSDSVFSSFLPRFSSFYKMEIVTFRTSHKLFTIYSDFFHFFLNLSTLKLSNSSASDRILLPLPRAFLQFDYFCLN
jgi:hypothetical protein